MPIRHPDQLTKNIFVPRDAFEVETPVDRCPDKVISTIMPTDAITETYPVIGVTQFNDIDYANKIVPNTFQNYVLRKMDRDQRPGFTRLFFTKEKSAAEAAIPYLTETEKDAHYWPPILEWLDLYYIDSINSVYNSGYFMKRGYRNSVDEDSTFVHEYFSGSTPFSVSKRSDAPQPTEIVIKAYTLDEVFQKCLHPEVIVPANSYVGAASSYALQSSMARLVFTAGVKHSTIEKNFQRYPATNKLTWQAYIFKEEPGYVQGLYTMKRTTVHPPKLSPLTTE